MVWWGHKPIVEFDTRLDFHNQCINTMKIIELRGDFTSETLKDLKGKNGISSNLISFSLGQWKGAFPAMRGFPSQQHTS